MDNNEFIEKQKLNIYDNEKKIVIKNIISTSLFIGIIYAIIIVLSFLTRNDNKDVYYSILLFSTIIYLLCIFAIYRISSMTLYKIKNGIASVEICVIKHTKTLPNKNKAYVAVYDSKEGRKEAFILKKAEYDNIHAGSQFVVITTPTFTSGYSVKNI